MSRQGDSFALGPWKEGDDAAHLRAFIVDDRGQSRSFAAEGATVDVSWSTFFVEAQLALEVFVKSRVSGSEDSFDSRAWSHLDRAPREHGNVLSSIWRGTDTIALVPTLNGRGGVFAIWPHALSEPRAAVLGADGARRGDFHEFTTPDGIMRCGSVTPTVSGGFVSFTDSTNSLRSYELGEEGQLVREVTWALPTPSVACPSFALAEGGLSFLLNRAAWDAPPDVGIYRMDAAGTVTELSPPPWKDAREVAMLADEPLVVRWSSLGAELARPGLGEVWPITLPAGNATRVPSEPGKIVLDFDSLEGGRTLVELTCR
ncbi:MAG: hypothetical protein EOO73_03275 [Myxococcales bacterium]|nr:MAG: hypothetical protein EOO73_03275 [Myxococcales bacterium]